MVKIGFLVLLTVLLLSCKNEEIVVTEPHLFVGSWKVDTAVKDGGLIEGLEGLQLTFQEDSNSTNKGTYKINSPYDSIWKEFGSWMLNEDSTSEDRRWGSYVMVRDSINKMFIYVDQKGINNQAQLTSQMLIGVSLPHTVTEEEWLSLCSIDTVYNDTICVLPILGDWQFLLSRDEVK
ncbi:MAG: hypothetical protein HRT61_21075 [Ekhidna sp.]|nr:hypothetical protein [Ekhidna sp.]